jgi:hypothetical protein
MCGRTAAVATSPAAEASMTLMTPGDSACARAATKIQLRTIPETRLPTLSFPVVENSFNLNPMAFGPKSPRFGLIVSLQHPDALIRRIVIPLLINTND